MLFLSRIGLFFGTQNIHIIEFVTINFSNMQKVVLFGRVSSVGDRQSYERQINDLTTFSETQHYQIVGVFAEKISGADQEP
jgi:predicted site-specific integrase-resolvase